MKASEYLKEHCSDLYFSPTDTKVRTALGLYAERCDKDKDGYSLENLEELLKECKIGGDNINECAIYVSHIKEYLNYKSNYPAFIDD